MLLSGRAVFTTQSFEDGEFLLVYGGELITNEEANEREQRDGENVPIYRYFFIFNSKYFWYVLLKNYVDFTTNYHIKK